MELDGNYGNVFRDAFERKSDELVLQLKRGALALLLGQSGSGKTSLSRLIQLQTCRDEPGWSRLECSDFFANFIRNLALLRNNDIIIKDFESFWHLVLIVQDLRARRNGESYRRDQFFKSKLVSVLEGHLEELDDFTRIWALWLHFMQKRFRRKRSFEQLFPGEGIENTGRSVELIRDVFGRYSFDEHDLFEASSNYFRSTKDSGSFIFLDGINVFNLKRSESFDIMGVRIGIDVEADYDHMRARFIRDFLFVLRGVLRETREGNGRGTFVLAGVETKNAPWFGLVGKEVNKSLFDLGFDVDSFNYRSLEAIWGKDLRRVLKRSAEETGLEVDTFELKVLSARFENERAEYSDLFWTPRLAQLFEEVLKFSEGFSVFGGDEAFEWVIKNARRHRRDSLDTIIQSIFSFDEADLVLRHLTEQFVDGDRIFRISDIEGFLSSRSNSYSRDTRNRIFRLMDILVEMRFLKDVSGSHAEMSSSAFLPVNH